ncbi:DUF2591 domain-containing protein [Paraburkholderia sp. BR14263]|uniref:DUF2591 domain-containing protein n=1 Tax=unclassified Paraburkholderia TaxID=2615204 RepID=UPI0034CD35E3
MKVSELHGALLDFWVGRCQGWHPSIIGDRCMQGRETSHEWIEFEPWSPSTDWSIGGPIIERERIELAPCSDLDTFLASIKPVRVFFYDEGLHPQFGPTMLVAAMRCYVASKFGEEVPA